MAQPERESLKPPNAPQPPSASQGATVPQTPTNPTPPVSQVPSAPPAPPVFKAPSVSQAPPAPQAPSVPKSRSEPGTGKGSQIGATRVAAGKNTATDECDPRRTFFARAAAIVIGAVIMIFPFAAGLFFFADPLRRRGAARGFIKVATLDSVPDDGAPHVFTVVANRTDAWTYFPSEPIGAVFMRREKGGAKLDVLQTTCPHAGCMLDYSSAGNDFKCPCHNSAFHLDGALAYGPSPRPMDSLAYEIRDNRGVKEVWVKFETFYTGVAEKIAKG
jgi:menaquinol-cytochrome c reductase iron-sulfur subunit